MSKTTVSPETSADRTAPPPPMPPMGLSRGPRVLKASLLITTLEGVFVFLSLVLDPPLGQGAWMFGMTRLRFAILGTTILLLAGLTWLTVRAHIDQAWFRGATRLAALASSRRNLALLTVALYTSAWFNIVAVVGRSLRTNLDAEILLKPVFNRGQFLGLWIFLIVLQAVVVLLTFSKDSTGQKMGLFLAGGCVLGLLLLYWYGAEGQILYYNLDMGDTDQSTYMDYARLLKVSGYTYPGDFNRMPVYPYLLSLVLRQAMPDPKFFLAAKYFNLFLSMLLLAGLAALFYRRFRPLHALNLILIVAFTVFIYKAGWVQAELLSYFLNGCLFVLMWRLLQKPSYTAAVAAGALAGLAHLTKASIWPALAVFGVLGLLRGGIQWLQRRRSPEAKLPPGSTVRALLVVPLTVAVFIAVIFPYLRASKRITGHYFYNVNSTFYFWYDSWGEAEAGTKAHGDRVGWPEMPPDEIPSMAKYLREHTAGEMIERVIDGGQNVMNRVVHSYGYADYIMVYGGLLALAVVWKRPQVRRSLAENPFPLLFFLGYFPLYILLCFWYSPISAGNRLILVVFIPLLLVLSSGLQTLLKEDRLRIGGKGIGWLTIIQLAILCMVSVDVFQALSHGVYILDGGG